MGALVPLMENGGDGPHLPWQFDQQTVEIYRRFVNIHYELVPFFLTAGTEAYQKGESVIQPLHPKQSLNSLFGISYFEYTLWDDIHVLPVTDNSTETTVKLPKSSAWVDYWDPTKIYSGKEIKSYQTPLNKIPIFLRQGSIIPLNVTKDDSNYGSRHSLGYLTFVLSYLAKNTSGKKGVIQQRGGGIELSYKYDASGLQISATLFATPLIILLQGVQTTGVTVIDQQLHEPLVQYASMMDLEEQEKGFYLDSKLKRLWIRSGKSSIGWIFSVQNV